MKFFDLEMEELLCYVVYEHIAPDGHCDKPVYKSDRGVAISSKCCYKMPMSAPMPEPRPEH